MGRFFACLWVFSFLQPLAVVTFAQNNLYEKALEKYRSKQYPEALELAQKALQEDSENPAKLHLYGLTLAATAQFEPAEENLRKAVSLAPDQAVFAYDLGALLHQERKYADAVPVLKRAIALDPDNLTARMMLARCYVFSYHELQIPNFSELTLEQLNYIVKKDPKFPRVHHHIALVYINSGQPEKAVAELNIELKYDPADSQARLELGETLLKLNQYHKAAEELLLAAKQAPQVPDIQYALAKAYKSEDRTTDALDAARKCVELNPQFANGHYLLGVLYRDSNQPELARQQFELFQQLKNSSAPPQ